MIFPLGHYVGRHQVRVGWDRHDLTEDEFGTWLLVHAYPSSAEIFDAAARAGVTERVETLMTRGLLTETDGDFTARHRLRPLLVGLGNSVEAPDRHAIGVPGLPPVAYLDPAAYELWQWGHLAPTLHHATEIDGDVLDRVRALVSTGCAYLDVVLK
ncbi:hypothetical protein [Actinokineospora sp. HUAS TT18]|uniref:hypothetical protein n=1 Tax=Actinokineospora sp. HUAS TT18 TaxID=3447451 RepID=UPI003F522B70